PNRQRPSPPPDRRHRGGAGMTKRERQFAVSGDWALGADSLQWILYRRASKRTGQWQAVSFVASTRVILERCMREKGCPAACQSISLAGLPPPSDRCRETRQKPLPPGPADPEAAQ